MNLVVIKSAATESENDAFEVCTILTYIEPFIKATDLFT